VIPGTVAPGASLPPAALNPTTISTGGATVTIYKIVIITGRKRYVPVKVSASSPRRVDATILTVKGKHRVATAHLSFRRHGRGTIHVGLKSRIKPGQYFMTVRVSTSKGRHVGRGIRVKFKLG
jgi:hypothetical protein